MQPRVLPSAVVLLVATLLVAPLAAAQAPPLPPGVPDPEAAIALACGLDPAVQETLPLCPRAEPAAPQLPEEGEHDHDQPAAPGSGNPETPQDLADEATETAGEVVENPGSAPGSILGLLGTLIQFVKDLLQLPVAGIGAGWTGFTGIMDALASQFDAAAAATATAGVATLDAASAAADAVATAAGAVMDAAASAGAFLLDLVTPDAPASAPETALDGALPDAVDARGALDALEPVTRAIPS